MKEAILEMVISMFKEHRKYDEHDLLTFESESFKESLWDKLEDLDIEANKVDTLDTVVRCLNFAQYGDTSDVDDVANIKEDLKVRGLEERLAFM